MINQFFDFNENRIDLMADMTIKVFNRDGEYLYSLCPNSTTYSVLMEEGKSGAWRFSV